MTYDWESNHTICQEVVVEFGKVCASTRHKLHCGLNLDDQPILPFDNIENVLSLLQDLDSLRLQVLDDRFWAIVCHQSSNVVE